VVKPGLLGTIKYLLQILQLIKTETSFFDEINEVAIVDTLNSSFSSTMKSILTHASIV